MSTLDPTLGTGSSPSSLSTCSTSSASSSSASSTDSSAGADTSRISPAAYLPPTARWEDVAAIAQASRSVAVFDPAAPGQFGTGTLSASIAYGPSIDLSLVDGMSLLEIAEVINDAEAGINARVVFSAKGYELEITTDDAYRRSAVAFQEDGTTLGLNDIAPRITTDLLVAIENRIVSPGIASVDTAYAAMAAAVHRAVAQRVLHQASTIQAENGTAQYRLFNGYKAALATFSLLREPEPTAPSLSTPSSPTSMTDPLAQHAADRRPADAPGAPRKERDPQSPTSLAPQGRAIGAYLAFMDEQRTVRAGAAANASSLMSAQED